MYIGKLKNFNLLCFYSLKKKIPPKLQNINLIISLASIFFINIFLQKVSIYLVLQLKYHKREVETFSLYCKVNMIITTPWILLFHEYFFMFKLNIFRVFWTKIHWIFSCAEHENLALRSSPMSQGLRYCSQIEILIWLLYIFSKDPENYNFCNFLENYFLEDVSLCSDKIHWNGKLTRGTHIPQ